jgi:hypothetical protein
VAGLVAIAGLMRRRALVKVVSAAASLALLAGAMAFAGGLAALTGMARESAVACTPAGSEVATAPEATGAGLEVRNAGRLLYELTPRQKSIARTYIAVGKQLGIPRSGQIIAIMMALQESSLRMLANPSVPASLHFANDGVGRDHDSIGSAQQRPAAGWGTVELLMDASYNARAFYGGQSGPNRGSPRGLLDIPGWQAMEKVWRPKPSRCLLSLNCMRVGSQRRRQSWLHLRVALLLPPVQIPRPRRGLRDLHTT